MARSASLPGRIDPLVVSIQVALAALSVNKAQGLEVCDSTNKYYDRLVDSKKSTIEVS